MNKYILKKKRFYDSYPGTVNIPLSYIKTLHPILAKKGFSIIQASKHLRKQEPVLIALVIF